MANGNGRNGGTNGRNGNGRNGNGKAASANGRAAKPAGYEKVVHRAYPRNGNGNGNGATRRKPQEYTSGKTFDEVQAEALRKAGA